MAETVEELAMRVDRALRHEIADHERTRVDRDAARADLAVLLDALVDEIGWATRISEKFHQHGPGTTVARGHRNCVPVFMVRSDAALSLLAARETQ